MESHLLDTQRVLHKLEMLKTQVRRPIITYQL